MKRRWWLISVSGYGEFAYYGTEEEAEGMRSHKAIWEGGIGKKKSIPATHHAAQDTILFTKQELERDGIELDERELQSIGRGGA